LSHYVAARNELGRRRTLAEAAEFGGGANVGHHATVYKPN